MPAESRIRHTHAGLPWLSATRVFYHFSGWFGGLWLTRRRLSTELRRCRRTEARKREATRWVAQLAGLQRTRTEWRSDKRRRPENEQRSSRGLVVGNGGL